MLIKISWQQALLFVGPDAQAGSLDSQMRHSHSHLIPHPHSLRWDLAGEEFALPQFFCLKADDTIFFFSYSISRPTENSPI